MTRCMPWPLAALCWADHRAHERLGEDVMRPVCAVHDLVWAFWLRAKRPARSARVPFWWKPWLTPWYALVAWWERPRPVKVGGFARDGDELSVMHGPAEPITDDCDGADGP